MTSPLCKSQWEKIEKRLIWTNTILDTIRHRVTGRIDTLNRKNATSDPSSLPQSHFRSWKVTDSFSAIIFYRDKLKRCRHLRCVQADDTDRLTCNVAYSDQVMTWPWPTWVKFQHYFLRIDHGSLDASWQIERDAGKMNVVSLWSQELLLIFLTTFFSYCSLEAKPLILGETRSHRNKRALKVLSNAFLSSTVALLGPELCASLSKNVEIGRIWPLINTPPLVMSLQYIRTNIDACYCC